MTSDERRQRLRRVYALLIKLANKEDKTTSSTETLTGDKVSVADGDTSVQQSQP